MDDIDNFQTRMDEVKGKGQKVIGASRGQPKVKDEVDSQLSNLDDSYMSLLATALQIKVCQACVIVMSYKHFLVKIIFHYGELTLLQGC